MEKKKLKIEDPATVREFTIIPVARIIRQELHRKHSVHFYAGKEPAALVVLGRKRQSAYDMTGEEISLRDLLQKLPRLAEVIEKYSA